MRKTFHHAAAAATVAMIVGACGARTGLDAPEPERDQCVSLDATAQIADLDVFIMMDSSNSMDLLTDQGVTKWQAVRDALAAFVLDPDSKGIGAAISFFPLVDPLVPEYCDDDKACGTPDDCHRYKICLPDSTEECETDADCVGLGFPDDTCHKIGFCENDLEVPCLPDDLIGCDIGQGACLDLGLCDSHFECDVSAYVPPAVDAAPLPDAATAVLFAIDSREPDGGTTTLPALQGALSHAAAWTESNPGHKAIVLLATDGFPTLCDPALDGEDPEVGIQHLADAAAEGTKLGVQTFVIGVFGPEEQEDAAVNLDLIAEGGGTESAYIINTASGVTDDFVLALNEVRLTSKSCEFAIPFIDGALPDLDRLTVHVTTPGGESVTVDRRLSAAGCDAVTGGFYYDKDPKGDVPPGRVILCPASCSLFGTAADRTVHLRVSCED